MTGEPDARPRIVMAVRNPVVHDARVIREAETLSAAGYSVVVFGLARRGYEEREQRAGVRILRITPGGRAIGSVRHLINDPLRLSRLWARFVRGRRRRIGAPLGRWDPPLVERILTGIHHVSKRLFTRALSGLVAWRFQVEVARAASKLDPDVVHFHDFSTIWAGYLTARHTGAPLVYDAHELYAHQNLPRFTRRRRVFVEAVEGFVGRRARAVVTVSESIADYLAEKYGIARPVVVLNTPALRTAPAEVDVPAPFSDPRPKMLYLGGIVRGRGLEQVIRATALLPEAILIIMGPVVRPDYVEELGGLISSLGIDDRVWILPPVPPEDVTAVAAHATIGLVMINNICLSYFFSMPNKLFESLHAGLPVVASDFPDIRRVVHEHEVGLLCDPDDPAAIAEAAKSLLTDPDYEAWRERARSAAKHFSWDIESRKLLDLYASLVPSGDTLGA